MAERKVTNNRLRGKHSCRLRALHENITKVCTNKNTKDHTDLINLTIKKTFIHSLTEQR